MKPGVTENGKSNSSLVVRTRNRCPPESVRARVSTREGFVEVAFMVNLEGQTDVEQDGPCAGEEHTRG